MFYAFGKQHFNALAVNEVENVRGLVREGFWEPGCAVGVMGSG